MYGLSPVATSSKVLEYQGKSGFFQPNTASKPLVAHLSSASADPTRFYNKKAQKPRKISIFRGFLISVSFVQLSKNLMRSDPACPSRMNSIFFAGQMPPQNRCHALAVPARTPRISLSGGLLFPAGNGIIWSTYLTRGNVAAKAPFRGQAH